MEPRLFKPVPTDILTQAVDRTLQVLRDPATAKRVAAYYTVSSNYAGATFLGLEPNSPDTIDEADLLATSTLRVTIPVYSIRQFLNDDGTRAKVKDTLASLPSKTLAETDDEDFVEMEAFYSLIKGRLARYSTKKSNPWVTASKLAARKRPALFPVRDRVVCQYLGTLPLRDCRRDWAVFRHLMRDETIAELVAALPEKATATTAHRDVVLDREPLRLLGLLHGLVTSEVASL